MSDVTPLPDQIRYLAASYPSTKGFVSRGAVADWLQGLLVRAVRVGAPLRALAARSAIERWPAMLRDMVSAEQVGEFLGSLASSVDREDYWGLVSPDGVLEGAVPFDEAGSADEAAAVMADVERRRFLQRRGFVVVPVAGVLVTPPSRH